MTTTKASPLSQLSALIESLTSSVAAFPIDQERLHPPAGGISLLDVKNELLLSYLQNLVFLIILKLRNEDSSEIPNANVIKKLIESRIYLERGVRPLEARLKYQIDKVLKAAEDTEKNEAQKKASQSHTTTANGENSDPASEDSDSDIGQSRNIDDLSYRPNPAALVRKPDALLPSNTKSQRSASSSNVPYRPPRITPTAMPTRGSSSSFNEPARKRKSHLLDEYIDAELSTAPQAQPSIGSNSTILNHGRSSLSARERAKQQERIEYEERNLTRLPTESKAERRKARLRGEGGRRDMFGGEDWAGLGGLGDRGQECEW